MAIIVQGSRVAGVGKPGLSAYDLAKKGGYTGTEAEFSRELNAATSFDDHLESHNLDLNAHPDIQALIDEKIDNIDISAEIGAHNEDEASHADIRQLIADIDIDGPIGAHNVDEAAHPYILGELTAIRTEHSNSVNSLNGTIATNATTAENYTNSSVAGLKTELTTGNTIVKAATQDGSGNVITTTYETKSDATAKLAEAKSYADGIKETLLNNSSEAIDSIFELRDAMTDNAEAIEALTEIAGSKAPAVHSHTKSQITDFPTSMPASDVSAWAKATSKPSYTANEVGAEAAGAVSTHNSSTSAHSDIRTLISNITGGTTTVAKATTATNATNIYSSASTAKAYILGTTTASSANHATVYNASVYTSGSVLYGAAWNDYAEYRIADCREPGRVICENGDDTLSLATERLQPGANVISDTFGFAIGETEMAKTPIAVSGRVLVYTYEDRNSYAPGDAVCAAPNGTVSKMTREEIREYPERIIGTVSAIPNYDTWGENNVSVNNRIWIKVK